MNDTTVSHCGNDHQQWLKSIDFYDDDLDILEKKLVEIISKNNGQEVMASVEHFQNQFIVQRNNIDELRHSINEHAGKVASGVHAPAGKGENVLDHEHDGLKEEFESFEKVISELRQEFNQFLAKWM
ncbi:MAG: hypothetical protein IPO53_01835 [Chitinophagaceae bacterium]|nr:hypothetical protein [Chitinophagaceae bacterium]